MRVSKFIFDKSLFLGQSSCWLKKLSKKYIILFKIISYLLLLIIIVKSSFTVCSFILKYIIIWSINSLDLFSVVLLSSSFITWKVVSNSFSLKITSIFLDLFLANECFSFSNLSLAFLKRSDWSLPIAFSYILLKRRKSFSSFISSHKVICPNNLFILSCILLVLYNLIGLLSNSFKVFDINLISSPKLFLWNIINESFINFNFSNVLFIVTIIAL